MNKKQYGLEIISHTQELQQDLKSLNKKAIILIGILDGEEDDECRSMAMDEFISASNQLETSLRHIYSSIYKWKKSNS